jgi:Mrp family chromosome partitioning ATPase
LQTSDEHITVAQCLLPCANLAGCVIVTTPQEVSLIDVRKEIVFCSKVNLPILGVVENMSGFVAPVGALNFSDVQGRNVTREALQMLSERFGGGLRVEGELLYAEAGAVKAMADEYGVPWLGSIAQDIEMSKATEQGRLIEQDGSVTVAGQVESIVCSLIARCEESHCRRDLGDRHDAKGST